MTGLPVLHSEQRFFTEIEKKYAYSEGFRFRRGPPFTPVFLPAVLKRDSRNRLCNKTYRALDFRRGYSSVFSCLPARHAQLFACMKKFSASPCWYKKINQYNAPQFIPQKRTNAQKPKISRTPSDSTARNNFRRQPAEDLV